MLRWYEPVWWAFFAGAALKSTVVLALAWILANLLRSRSAAWRHLVWTAAAAAVLALPVLSVELPELRLPVNMPALTFHATATAGSPDQAAANAATPGNASTAVQPAKPVWQPDWALYAMLLWMAGTAIGLGRLAWAAAAMARLRRTLRPYGGEDFRALAAELGLDGPAPVFESAPGAMPMTFGLLRPAVALPADAAAWSEERRRMVLLHELAHVRRGDVAAHLVARIALCFYWWNPLAWLAWREFLKEREKATDDLVLATGTRASDYAAELLEVARAMRPAEADGWAAIAMARRSELEGRLLSILDGQVNRNAAGRASMLAASLAAVLLVAPFAAVQAQDQSSAGVPADVDATVRAALAQKNHEILDNAANAFEKLRQYETAQKLLESSLQVREETSGQQSADYGEGLAKLGDLAVAEGQRGKALDYFTRAQQAIGGGPAAAHSLFWLGVLNLDKKDYAQAAQYFQQMQAADPSKAGEALTWLGLTHEREPDAAVQAEADYRQAIAVEGSDTKDATVTMDLLARLLKTQDRAAEADQLSANAAALRAQAAAEVRAKTPNVSSGAYHVGGGVTAPKVLHKLEPEYDEMARAAKYQGTVLLYVEIGPDGRAHNARVVRSLGMGLDEKAIDAVQQWVFQPGMKEGQPVTVAATIEVNFRLL
jgi:TonB family protein